MALPTHERDLTPDWLTDTMRRAGSLTKGRVKSVRAERIAEGVGLMARLARFHLDYEGAEANASSSLVAKVPSDIAQNRQIADFYRFYQRECDFYTHHASRSPLRVAKSFGIERDREGDFVLLLEDLGKGRIGDQVAGNRAEDAIAAITALAEHHAAFWGEAQNIAHVVDYDEVPFMLALEATYARSIGPTIEGYPQHFTPAFREIAIELGHKTTPMLKAESDKPRTIVHGDFRSDNIFYDLPDAPLAILDWQICGRGYGPFDVAYHLTQSVTPEVRRAIERPALEGYLRVLKERGVRDLSFGDLWESYRHNALFALVYPITICGSLDLTNPRERALGDLVLGRSLSAIADLNAAEKLPQ